MNRFDPGLRITVEFANPDGHLDVILTRIVACTRRSMVLQDPDPGGPPFAFEPDGEVMVRIDDEETVTSARVHFRERGEATGIVFDAPYAAEHYPKRRFFRMAVSLPLTVGRIPCRAVDLSGNGLLAICPHTLEATVGGLYDGLLHLPSRPVQVFLRLVRHVQGRQGALAVGFEYHEISEADQDRIIAYIMDRQRQGLRVTRL